MPRQTGEQPVHEGFVVLDDEEFFVIPNVDRLRPFLFTLVGDADHWMFLSSNGGLTAGRGGPEAALFPYETDDRLHFAGGVTGPVSAIRPHGSGVETTWTPFRGVPPPGARRNLYKSVVGNQVVFEEIHPDLGLRFRYRWSSSDRFGFVRTATIVNEGGHSAPVDLVDGLVNLMPFGLEPSLYQRMSNLTNAYKRSELVDAEARLAVYSLEALVVDRPEPAEALRGSVAWSAGLEGASIGLDRDTIDAFEAGAAASPLSLVTGRPGAYLLSHTIDLAPGESAEWRIVADVHRDQRDVAELRRFLRTSSSVVGEVDDSVRRGTDSLSALTASSDGLQHTGDRVAAAHHLANVTFNVMRGGVFLSGYDVRTSDFVAFVAARNRAVGDQHRSLLENLPASVGRSDLLRMAEHSGDAHLTRLALEYLPLSFSRRHGDPSRPWNAFSIRVRDGDGEPIIRYEGNWRDIFQNWEGLCLSFPEYLPSVVSVFVNASTPDGFNPYRISRDGIDWEVPDPNDPWSHIGYWGDHQIVYLQRLLEAGRRFLPGELEAMLGRAWFSFADVPYRIAPYDEVVRDPKETIRYDGTAADRSAARVGELGSDGRLLTGADGRVYLVTLLEKLLVPVLSKLSNYVPGGGIWMNTQRPEWNDANNALVGHGLSMVTLYHLRRYLSTLAALITDSGIAGVPMSSEVADWLGGITAILRGNTGLIGGDLTDRRRREVVDALGRAFSSYRSRVYASGFGGTAPVGVSAVMELCAVAVDHLDDTIRRNRRPDGLYHSYNLIDFADDGSEARVDHLHEMLEGQVAVLSSGLLDADERADVIEALFAGSLYRPDQRSFLLYPARRLPSFLEKNVVPAARVAGDPLLSRLAEAGVVIRADADGRHRFDPDFRSGRDLEEALHRLALEDEWRTIVTAHRAGALAAYEDTFHHHEFTGRSGSMYGYEGIGSIYWHMVAKLLVAAQESVVDALDEGAAPETVERLIDAYWRIRSGLGFNKTAEEYGAFPIDPYSHTPAHTGAQQPGMTGQVKEEILTRLLEVGLRIDEGEIRFDPVLFRSEEFLDSPKTWHVHDVEANRIAVELPDRSLGLTLCQVPIVVTLTDGPATIEIVHRDGTEHRSEGLRLDRETSRAIFGRTGEIAVLRAHIPDPGLV